jgi:hypothetical protein
MTAPTTAPPVAPARRWRPNPGLVFGCLSLLGLGGLCFVGGAAAMHFRLPPSRSLAEAFRGAEIWFARANRPVAAPGDMGEPELNLDRPDATCDGFTLYTTTEAAEARLIDMRGRVVHRWKMPAKGDWPRKAGVPKPRDGQGIHWERCHLYPNGDLLALCCVGSDTPYGYALVKLNKDSELIWGFSEQVHHDVTVGEDGRIYTIVHELAGKAPSGFDSSFPSPYLAESLVVLSPQGKELDRVALVETFRDSPFRLTLLSGEAIEVKQRSEGGPPGPPPGPPQPGMPPHPGGPPPSAAPPPDPASKPPNLHQPMPGDVLHVNSVCVLPRSLAGKFPRFAPGQVLLSMRTPSALAVLDVKKRAVVWAARGPWRHQHDAQFLDSGRLLLFDNLGSPKGARVLEYDPATQAVPWHYSGRGDSAVDAPVRGCCQRLANGNTLFVDCRGMVHEVAADGEPAWRWGFSLTEPQEHLSVTAARRYRPEELTFLQGVSHARP